MPKGEMEIDIRILQRLTYAEVINKMHVLDVS